MQHRHDRVSDAFRSLTLIYHKQCSSIWKRSSFPPFYQEFFTLAWSFFTSFSNGRTRLGLYLDNIVTGMLLVRACAFMTFALVHINYSRGPSPYRLLNMPPLPTNHFRILNRWRCHPLCAFAVPKCQMCSRCLYLIELSKTSRRKSRRSWQIPDIFLFPPRTLLKFKTRLVSMQSHVLFLTHFNCVV